MTMAPKTTASIMMAMALGIASGWSSSAAAQTSLKGGAACQSKGKTRTNFDFKHAVVTVSKATGLVRITLMGEKPSASEEKHISMSALGEWDAAPADYDLPNSLIPRMQALEAKSVRLTLGAISEDDVKAKKPWSLPPVYTLDNVGYAFLHSCLVLVNLSSELDMAKDAEQDADNRYAFRRVFKTIQIPTTPGAATISAEFKASPMMGMADFKVELSTAVFVY